MPTTESKADCCLQWAVSQGARIEGISISQLPGRGTSLLSTAKSSPKLIFVPAHLLLNLKNIRNFAHSTPAFAELCQEWSTRVPLTARRYIILLMAYTVRHSSPWSVYLEALPEYVDSPVFWAEDERALLAGTSIAGVAEDKIAFLTAWLGYQQRQGSPSALTQSLTLRELMHYEMLVDSRALLSDEEDSCMVPIIDFANHSSLRGKHTSGHQNATWKVDAAGFYLEVQPDTPDGHEVLFSYGRRGNGELLIKYGFVEEAQMPTGSRSVTIEVDIDQSNDFLLSYGEPYFRIMPDADHEPLLDEESSFVWLQTLVDETHVNWQDSTYKGTKFSGDTILSLLQAQPSNEWQTLQVKAYRLGIAWLQRQLRDLRAAEEDPNLIAVAGTIDEQRLHTIDAVRDSERLTIEKVLERMSNRLEELSKK